MGVPFRQTDEDSLTSDPPPVNKLNEGKGGMTSRSLYIPPQPNYRLALQVRLEKSLLLMDLRESDALDSSYLSPVDAGSAEGIRTA